MDEIILKLKLKNVFDYDYDNKFSLEQNLIKLKEHIEKQSSQKDRNMKNE